MKKPTFKPVWFEGRDFPWAINVPPYLSPTQKPQRRFFLLKKDADAFGSHMRRQADDHAHGATYLSRDRMGDAAKAYDVLAGLEEITGRKYTLLAAVQDFAERQRQASKSVTLDQLFDEYLAARQDRSTAYLKQLRWFRGKLVRLSPRIVSTITAGDIETALRHETPSNRNGFIRYLKAIFIYGIKKGYLEKNPISGVEFSSVKLGEVQVYTPDEVQRLTDDCLANDLALLPYRAFTVFCGVRAKGEAARIQWSDLNWEEKVLKLRSGVTKTNHTRFINVSENCMAWLGEYRLRGGSIEGPIVSYTHSQLENRRAANFKRAGVTPKANAARHSYCSYYLSLHQKIDELALQSGHRSTDVLFRHYYQAVRREDAEKFWSVLPKAESSNIVAFSA
jgi:integrase